MGGLFYRSTDLFGLVFEKNQKKAEDRGVIYREVQDFVVGLQRNSKNGYKVETHLGESIQADQVILMTGAYSKLMEDLLPDRSKFLEKAKVVSGSYLIFEDVDLVFDAVSGPGLKGEGKSEESFGITYKGPQLYLPGLEEVLFNWWDN